MGEVKLSEPMRACLTQAISGCVHTFARGAYRRRSGRDPGAFRAITLMALAERGLLLRRGTQEAWDITPAGREALRASDGGGA